LLEPHPGRHPAREAVAFAHGFHHIDHLAIHQAEVAGIKRDFHIRDAEDDAIKQGGREPFEPGFALPFGAHGIDHFVALFPLFCQFMDNFRRILQIGIDDNDRVTPRIIPARSDGNLVPEIAGKNDRAYQLILTG